MKLWFELGLSGLSAGPEKVVGLIFIDFWIAGGWPLNVSHCFSCWIWLHFVELGNYRLWLVFNWGTLSFICLIVTCIPLSKACFCKFKIVCKDKSTVFVYWFMVSPCITFYILWLGEEFLLYIGDLIFYSANFVLSHSQCGINLDFASLLFSARFLDNFRLDVCKLSFKLISHSVLQQVHYFMYLLKSTE